MKILVVLLVFGLFLSCNKSKLETPPVTPHDNPNGTIVQVTLRSDVATNNAMRSTAADPKTAKSATGKSAGGIVVTYGSEGSVGGSKTGETATKTTTDTKIHNVWAIQFDRLVDGSAIVGVPSYANDVTRNVTTGNYDITMSLTESAAGGCVYFITNVADNMYSAAGDFNLKRNHNYTITATIDGINPSDHRIEVNIPDISNSAMVFLGERAFFDIDINKSAADDGKGVLTDQYNMNALISDWSKVHAKVLWQDAENLILSPTSISINKNAKTMTVKANNTGIMGNAVVALYASEDDAAADDGSGGKVLWSWHVWVTDYNPNKRDNPTDEWTVDKAYGDTGGEVHSR